MPADRAEAIYRAQWAAGWKPDPDLSISDWADQFRILPKQASSEPGRWRTSRTPYLREIMGCLSPHSRVERVVLMKGAQLGGTEIGFNWIGFIIHQCPGPVLMVEPTVEIAKRLSKQRLAPSIEATPVLRERIAEPRSRDAGNTMFIKEFPGGLLILTGANSAVGLRSMPIRYLFLDEVDGYPGDVDGEGDPVLLAEKRTDTFAKKKIFLVSTPNKRGSSRIEREFLLTDQRRYFVPCPKCGNFDWLRWPNIRWDEGKPHTAKLLCEKCGALIEERHKTWMLERGEWRPTATGDGRSAGYHLSSLYSPLGWLSWADIAREFMAAKNDPAKLKTWLNTVLGETWQERGEAPDWQEVAALRLPYRAGEVPDGVRAITAGVDVHKNFLVYAVRGWGVASESWLIEHGEIWGDTDTREVWGKLAGLLERRYDGRTIDRMLIDSGYRPDAVYAFARVYPGRVIPTKGQLAQDRPLKATRLDVSRHGAPLDGMMLWHIWTHAFKSWVHGRIHWPPGEPGGWHLCEDATDDYCKQIISETLIVASNGKQTWKADGANHYFDCEVLNAAAAEMLRVDLLSADGPPKSIRRRVISRGLGHGA